MRQWLLFILSFFFLVTSVPGKAGVVMPGKSSGTVEIKSAGKVLIDYSNHIESSAFARSQTFRNLIKQFRHFPYTNFLNTIVFVNNAAILREKPAAVKSYLYCKSIGLKLIFPQHYYW